MLKLYKSDKAKYILVDIMFDGENYWWRYLSKMFLLKLNKLFIFVLAVSIILGGGTIVADGLTENEKKEEPEKITYAHELDVYAYNGNDLGAVYTKEATTFKVWAPKASGIAVKIYSTGSSYEKDAQDISTTLMKKDEKNGVWTATVKGDKKNLYYTYLITNDGITIETADVYSKAVGVNGNRSMIVDLESTNPKGWENDNHVLCDDPTDAIVWEVHVRDFSSGEVSGVSLKNKGKYLAFTETGTTLGGNGEIPTCIDYLKKLGVTHVQLMPVYDYATIDETNPDSGEYNWGYDPKNYNVPEGSYSTDPYHGEVRINEFKQMVMALHNAGIGVIMDVVYNHTYTAKGSCFENTVPGYYFRLKSDGTLSDASGCGNETASDHLMYRKYMIDSILYWTNEYHIDGYRFDLMGVHDVTTMNEIRKALDTKVKDGKKIIMYGEPWTAASVGTKEKTCVKDNIKLLDNRIGAFNDTFRDAVKGHVFYASEPGFVQDGSSKTQLMESIKANTDSSGMVWFNQPSQAVSYISAHDNYTLYDKLILSTKKDESFSKRDNEIVDMNKLAAAITLTSQGIAFMQAGEDFARTKFGDENSYISPDSINSLNWNNLVTYGDLSSYYQGLIEIRKNFKPFRDSTNLSAQSIAYSQTDNGVIAYTLENKITKGKEWSYIAAAFNSTNVEKKVSLVPADGSALPKEWIVIANKDEAGLLSLATVSGNEIEIPAKSAVILVDKESFEKLDIKSEKCTVRAEYRDDSGKMIYSHVLKGNKGEVYNVSHDEALELMYDFLKVSGEEKGQFTEEPKIITYYYKKFSGKISSLTVNYIRENVNTLGVSESSVAESVVLSVRDGDDYTAPVKNIEKLKLDLDMFPSNAVGKMGMNDITVNYYYTAVDVSDLIIHYHNEENWKHVGAYVYYTGDEDNSVKELTAAVPGNEMKADKELGENWFTVTLKNKGSITGLKVCFYDMDSENYSVKSNEYSVKHEVWIEDGKVFGTGEVNVIYVQNNGRLLDSETILGKEGTKYITAEKQFEGLNLYSTTSNLEGKYTSSPTYVIYSYDEKDIIEKPITRLTILLAVSGGIMIAVSLLLFLSYNRRKKEIITY